MENALPKNWVETKLGEVADLSSGYGFPIKYQGFNDYNIPFFKVGDISQNFKKGNVFLKECNNFINEDILKSIKAKKISKESIVFAKIGEAIRLNRRAITSTDCVIDNNVMALKFTKIVLFKYGYYFFETVKLIDLSAGNAVPSIRKSVVEEISFPLPPLAEQERIVAKLDALFTQQEVMKKALSRIPDLLKDFRQQVLTQAVTGKLTESWREGKELEIWKKKKLSELGDFISGFAFKSSDFIDDGIQLIRMGNLYNNILDLKRSPVFLPINFEPKIVKKYSTQNGDILLSLTGTKYKRDYGFAIEITTDDHLLINQRILCIRPKIESKFLTYVLRNNIFRDQFFEFETGGVNQGNVGVKNISNIILHIPSVSEQQEIVSRVESLFAKADVIEERYKKLKVKIDTLPQAILHKAFKGELVEQLSTDGDAKDLLKEIMALKDLKLKKK